MENVDPDNQLKELRVVVFLTTLIKYKIIKLLTALVALNFICIVVIQTYFIFTVLDMSFLIKYSPAYLASYMAILSGYYMLFDSLENYNFILSSLNWWKLSSTSLKIQNKIKLEVQLFTLFIGFCFVMGFITAYAHALPEDDDSEIFFIILFLHEYMPHYGYIFEVITRSIYLLLPYVVIMPIIQFLLLITLFKFQFYMFVNRLENLENGYEGVAANNLFYNMAFQATIKKRMTFCIKRHIEFISTIKLLSGRLGFTVIAFLQLGILCCICMVFFLRQFEGNWSNRYIRLGTLVIPVCVAGVVVTLTTQLYENEYANIYTALTKTKWYYWNNENKKKMLVFLMHMKKPLQIQFYNRQPPNFEAGIDILKTVYSLSSVAYKI